MNQWKALKSPAIKFFLLPSPPLSLITISHIYLSRETISICHNLRNITLEKKRSNYHFAPGSCLKLPFSVHIFRCLTLRVLKDRPPSGFACDFLSGPLMLVWAVFQLPAKRRWTALWSNCLMILHCQFPTMVFLGSGWRLASFRNCFTPLTSYPAFLSLPSVSRKGSPVAEGGKKI